MNIKCIEKIIEDNINILIFYDDTIQFIYGNSMVSVDTIYNTIHIQEGGIGMEIKGYNENKVNILCYDFDDSVIDIELDYKNVLLTPFSVKKVLGNDSVVSYMTSKFDDLKDDTLLCAAWLVMCSIDVGVSLDKLFDSVGYDYSGYVQIIKKENIDLEKCYECILKEVVICDV